MAWSKVPRVRAVCVSAQGVLAQYYSLPWVSFRDATWRSLRQNVSGFSMDEIMALPRNDHHPNDRGHLCASMTLIMTYLPSRAILSSSCTLTVRPTGVITPCPHPSGMRLLLNLSAVVSALCAAATS